jgi:hypothetical protein
MVVFTSIRKALECAVAIQRDLEERNFESPGDEVRVRIGINFGEVTVDDNDIYGQAVNAAARIAGRAKGGEILVSDVVRRLVGSGPEFNFADRGRVRLKGFPDRWHLYGVVPDTSGIAAAGSAGHSAFAAGSWAFSPSYSTTSTCPGGWTPPSAATSASGPTTCSSRSARFRSHSV